MLYSVNDKRLVSLTVADIVACSEDTLNIARAAGSDAATQKKYINFEVIQSIYSKIDLNNADQCERVRRIVSAYSNGYITGATVGVKKPEVYASPIVIVSQVSTFPVSGTRKDVPTTASRFLNASIFKLLQILNEDNQSTDDLYISNANYEKMLNSTLYQILDVFKSVENKKIYPLTVEFIKTLNFVDDLILNPMIQSLLRFYDIYVNQYDFKVVRDIILDVCDHESRKIEKSKRDKLIGNFLPANKLDDFASDIYSMLNSSLREDSTNIDPFVIATAIAERRSVFLSVMMETHLDTIENIRFAVDNEISNVINMVIQENPVYEKTLNEVKSQYLSIDTEDYVMNKYKSISDYDDYFFMKAGLPDLDHIFEVEEDYDTSALEASYQQTGNSLKRMDVRSAFKLAKDNVNKLSKQLDNVIGAIKNYITSADDMDYIVVEGKKFTFTGLVRKVLGGVALFSFSKVFAICYLIVKWAGTAKAKKESKRKMTMLLNEEIEIVTEKIEDARAAGDNKAKYALMRSKKELENARDRVKYGIGAEVKSKAVDDMIKRAKGEPISQRDRLGRYQDGHTPAKRTGGSRV